MDRLTLKFASEQTSGFSGTEHLVIRTEYYRQGRLLSSHVPAFVYSLGAPENGRGRGVDEKIPTSKSNPRFYSCISDTIFACR